MCLAWPYGDVWTREVLPSPARNRTLLSNILTVTEHCYRQARCLFLGRRLPSGVAQRRQRAAGVAQESTRTITARVVTESQLSPRAVCLERSLLSDFTPSRH
jgi:hypothetical protein